MMIVQTVLKAASLISKDKHQVGFTFHKALFKCVGADFWPPSPSKSLPDKILFALGNVAYPLTYFTLMIFFGVCGTVFIATAPISTDEEFKEFIKSIIGTMTIFYSTFKMVFTFYQRKKVTELVKFVESLGSVGNSKRDLDIAVHFSVYYLMLLCSCSGTWAVEATLINRVQKWPMSAAFPWEEKTTLGWLIGFIIEWICALYCALWHTCVDTLLPVSIAIACGHLKILEDMLSVIGTHPEKIVNSEARDYNTVRKCVQLHAKLLKVAEMMISVNETLLSSQVVYTVLHSCVITFALMKVTDVGSVLFNVFPLLVSSYLQLLFYCFYGQKVTDKFADILFGVYNNEWYQSSIKTRKALALMGLMSHKEIKLTGFGIFEASHKTYLSSLQDSVSYFLFLKTMTSDE